MEGGVVGSQHAAVHVGALGGLLLDCAKVGGAFHPHFEAVARGQETAGHIEASTHEGSLYAPEVMAVEADRGFPVDTIEIQEQTILLESFGYLKLIPIPEIRVEE